MGLKEKIIELRLKKQSYKNIAKILNCSLATISYHCKKNDLSHIGLKCNEKISQNKIDNIKIFYLHNSLSDTSIHFNVSKATILKYCDSKRVLLNEKERKQNKVNAVTRRRKKIKQLAVELKGGKCENCGYNKCIGALEFHHKNPEEKDFQISGRGNCKSWESIKKELKKCILVCANCHREIHEELKK